MSDSTPLPASAVGDLRAAARYDSGSTSVSTVVFQGGGTSHTGRLLDISAGGLAFLTDHHVEPHTRLTVELPSKDALGKRRLSIAVRSATLVTAGIWKIGCEFASRLSSSELLALL
jgi:hypothetical protein